MWDLERDRAEEAAAWPSKIERIVVTYVYTHYTQVTSLVRSAKIIKF